MEIITTNKDWSLKVSYCVVAFRKVIALSAFDKVLLKLLSIQNGAIDKNKFGLLLGFGMINIPEKNIYKDLAEIALFNQFLSSLKDFNLIDEVDDEETEEQQIQLSYWGNKALENNAKYLFYQGDIPIYNHLYLSYEEKENHFFPFYKFSVDFSIKNAKEIEPYELEKSKEDEFNNLLNKIKFNSKADNKSFLIDKVIKKKESISEKIISLQLNLLRNKEKSILKTGINNNPLIELDLLLKRQENKAIYLDLLYFTGYQEISKNALEIKADILSKYRKYVDWNLILKDKRIIWDNELLNLLEEKDISSGSLWIDVVSHCPKDFLTTQLSNYQDYLNWQELTNILDVDYIIQEYEPYLWDTEILINRANTSQIESLLLKGNIEDEYLDWSIIMPKLKDDFIQQNINNINFNLIFITENRKNLAEKLLTKYPKKRWNWQIISTEYQLSYILKNIKSFYSFLSIDSLLLRILNASDDILNEFQQNLIFNKELESFSSKEDRTFYISSWHDVILDTKRLVFLNKYNLIFWGENDIVGIEANENLIWNKDIFNIFKNKVKSYLGLKQVTSTIPNLSIIKKNTDFEWDYTILSQRGDIIDDINFIKNNQQKFDFIALIKTIHLDLFQNELVFFYEWAVSSEELFNFIECLQDRFEFQRLLTIIALYDLFQLDFNWTNTIQKTKILDIGNVFKFNSTRINKLKDVSFLRKLVTQKFSLDFILDRDDLKWDWEVITTEKFEEKHFLDNNILTTYAHEIYWPYIIQEIFTVQNLTIDERLFEIVDYLSKASIEMQDKTWTILTGKLSNFELWKAIDLTEGHELFKWDWDLISSTDKINFSIDKLKRYRKRINWNKLSQNNSLGKIWRYSKNFNNERRWFNHVLNYLKLFQRNWNFELLSEINEITWNEGIIRRFENKWDWDILSKESSLFIEEENGRVFYRIDRLKIYARKINWKILSSRYDVIIPEEDFKQFLREDWDFQVLSKHPKLSLSFEILERTVHRNWDWKTLTRHRSLQLRKELLLGKKITSEQEEDIEEWKWIGKQDWDWEFLSKANWLDNQILQELPEKEWDWKSISKNRNLVFDENLIEFLLNKSNVDWTSILKNKRTHLTLNILQLLESRISLSKSDWNIISHHNKLNFTQINNNNVSSFAWNFVDRYRKFWNWDILISEKKIDVSDFKILKQYEDYLDWELVSNLLDKPTLEVLNSFKDKLDWVTISKKIELSQNILIEFQDYLDWEVISKKIELSEENLTEFQDYLNWEDISRATRIDFDTILINKFYVNWHWHELLNNLKIKDNQEVYNHIINEIGKNFLLEHIVHLQEDYSNWKGHVYHYTHLSNALKILKEGKIKSRKLAKQYNNSAGNVWKSNSRAWDYARFYFRPKTPNQFYNEGLGLLNEDKEYLYAKWQLMDCPKCPFPIFFKIDMYAFLRLDLSKFFISNGNMQRRQTKFNSIENILPIFNYQDVYHSEYYEKEDAERIKNAREQEFLIRDMLDLDLIPLNKLTIVVPDEFIKKLLVNSNISSKYKKRIKIDYSLFRRENPIININENSDTFSFRCDFNDTVFFRLFLLKNMVVNTDSIRGNFLCPPIETERYKILHLNGNVEISNSETFTIVLSDNQPRDKKNKQDWLIFSNDDNLDDVFRNHIKTYSHKTSESLSYN